MGSSKSETIYFILDTFSDFEHFIAVINGKLLNKKKIILYQKVFTDKTWWPGMGYQFPNKKPSDHYQRSDGFPLELALFRFLAQRPA
jgi:hypothetical protein